MNIRPALLALACLFVAFAIMAGALGTHQLSGPEAIKQVETATQYQIWHGLAILILRNVRPGALIWPVGLILAERTLIPTVPIDE